MLTSAYACELDFWNFPDKCSQDDRTPEKRTLIVILLAGDDDLGRGRPRCKRRVTLSTAIQVYGGGRSPVTGCSRAWRRFVSVPSHSRSCGGARKRPFKVLDQASEPRRTTVNGGPRNWKADDPSGDGTLDRGQRLPAAPGPTRRLRLILRQPAGFLCKLSCEPPPPVLLRQAGGLSYPARQRYPYGWPLHPEASCSGNPIYQRHRLCRDRMPYVACLSVAGWYRQNHSLPMLPSQTLVILTVLEERASACKDYVSLSDQGYIFFGLLVLLLSAGLAALSFVVYGEEMGPHILATIIGILGEAALVVLVLDRMAKSQERREWRFTGTVVSRGVAACMVD